ncbi:TetR/AcrR family transcriptional regulator [Agromyces humatus]|uniref:TetR/AcrR family transcriptional regulator n=1 Tax=Agromyces humatus TaxID=279573 RepID=A0ABP4WX24_9MICO|nr:TetR/AcrR family transcriptional regulator [Agromyces humatus]
MTPSPPALPVQARAWDTRERILAAAVTCLADEGYSATTTSRIQEIAGVSRGSILHQFPSREDLLIAAVHHLAAQRDGGLDVDEEVLDVGGDIDRAVDVMWSMFHGALFRAALQLWVASAHNPALAATLGPRERELGRRNRDRIQRLFGERHTAHPRFADLISLLHNSMRGVALTYAFAPKDFATDPHLDVWRRTAHHMLDA